MTAAHPFAWRVNRLAGRIGPDVCAVPGLGYVVSGAELLRAVLLDVKRFRKDGPSSAGAVITQVLGPVALANMDGPAHTELRRLLRPFFTRNRTERILAEAAERLMFSLKERLVAGEAVDLAHASNTAVGAVMHAMATSGSNLLSEHDALRLHRTATSLAGVLSSRLRPLTRSECNRAIDLRDALIEGLSTSATSAGPGTLTGRLRDAGLDATAVQGVLAMLLVAGMETTSAALSRVLAVLTDVGCWKNLTSRSAIQHAVDEALRYVCPLPVFTRTVVEECELGSHRLRAGRSLVGNIHNALRDGRVIERGDEFDPDRAAPPILRQLWFGMGAHACIGMPLARTFVLQTVRMLASLGGVEVVERVPHRRVLIPAYRKLLVTRRVTPTVAAR